MLRRHLPFFNRFPGEGRGLVAMVDLTKRSVHLRRCLNWAPAFAGEAFFAARMGRAECAEASP